MSRLRRPILMPIENAPSGFSAIGTEGWPTLPRVGSSFTTSASASRRAMMICTVCGVSRVSRAMSAFETLPFRRIACSTTRSLNWRMPTWFEPRGRSRCTA